MDRLKELKKKELLGKNISISRYTLWSMVQDVAALLRMFFQTYTVEKGDALLGAQVSGTGNPAPFNGTIEAIPLFPVSQGDPSQAS